MGETHCVERGGRRPKPVLSGARQRSVTDRMVRSIGLPCLEREWGGVGWSRRVEELRRVDKKDGVDHYHGAVTAKAEHVKGRADARRYKTKKG